MSILLQIKALVDAEKIIYTLKADLEIARDGISRSIVRQAILNAPAIVKTIRSTSSVTGKREMLYVLVGITYTGLVIYTKGKILRKGGEEVFYVIISSKWDIQNDPRF